MIRLFAVFLACVVTAIVIDASAAVRFKKRKIKLGPHVLTVEIADNDEKRARGLMFREKLEPNSGMLFIFDREQALAFWMKNTLIPLSIGYFDANKKLVDVKEMVPAALGDRFPPSYPSRKPAKYALEMSKGWFEKNRISVGTSFSFVDGPQPQP